MAEFSFKAGFCSRSSGKGAVAQAAYRAGENFKDEHRGREFDFSQKVDQHDIHQRVLLPKNAPEWMKSSEKLWNYVQSFETNLILKRYSGNQNDPVAREKSLAGREKALNSAQDSATQIIGLPRELNKKQNIEMLETYLQKMFVSKGLVTDYSIHMDKGNWHAHVAVALRPVMPNGEFSEKKITSYRDAESFKDPFSRGEFTETRRVLAETMNSTFERLGFATRVDHRSLEDRGIKRRATIHEGPYARILEGEGETARLFEINREIKAQNIALYLENPAYFLSDMAREAVVFSEGDVATKIHKLVDGDEKSFQDLYTKVQGVSIPESAKQPSNGGFQYKSDELISHFDDVFKSQKPTADVIDFVRVGAGVAEDYLSRELEEETFARIGISNKLQKKYDLTPEEALEQVLKDPSCLINELAKEKIVFREKDVINTIHGLIGENETTYRLLEAHGEGRPIMEGLKVPANQTIKFSDEFVTKEIDYWVGNLVKDIMYREECLALGTDVKHQEIFTSKAQNQAEIQTLERVQRLASDTEKFALSDSFVSKTIHDFQKSEHEKLILSKPDISFKYSSEQKMAIENLLSPGQLKVLKGRAGTGKSTVLKPVVYAFESQGYDVKGMAFQGKVSDSMSGDLDLNARTIDSYQYSWDEYNKAEEILSRKGPVDLKVWEDAEDTLEKYSADQITKKSVVVIDEGSLVSHSHYETLLSKVESVGAKMLIVKDDAQNKAIHGADISAAMDTYVDSTSLTKVQRQRLPWMKKASEAFNDHRIEEGLLAYEDRGHIHYYGTFEETKKGFVDRYLLGFSPEISSLGLTYLNSDVRDLNSGILKGLQEKGVIEKETFSLAGKPLGIGAQVMFTSNDNTGWKVETIEANGSSRVGVKNGTFGKVEFFNPKTQEIRVRLQRDGRLVGFNTPEDIERGKFYDGLELGYVMTTSKSQGETFGQNDFLATPNETANSFLVGSTRHIEDLRTHVCKEHASDFRGIAKMVGGGVYCGTSLDFSVTEEQRPYLNKVSLYRDLNIEFAQTNGKKDIYKKDYLEAHPNEAWESPAAQEHREVMAVFSRKLEDLKDDRKTVAGDILENWNDCSKFVSQAGIREENLSLHSGKTQGNYTKLELKRLETVEQYFDVAVETRALRETMQADIPRALLKTHKNYGDYEALVEKQGALAWRICLSPESYKTLFKVEYIYGQGEEPIGYEMIGGKRYPYCPPTFDRAQEHAESVVSREWTFEDSKTGRLQSQLYELLKEYKEAHSQNRQIYHSLKEDLSVFKTPAVKELLEFQQVESEKNRCEKAYGALNILDRLSYGDSDPILKHLGFGVKEQTDFMDMAIQGQRMERLKTYHAETELAPRLEQSTQFYEEMFSGGVCDRKAYGQIKGLGESTQRFTFEANYVAYLELGGKPLYNSVKVLKAAYSSIEFYKEHCQENRENWTVIKTDIKARVDTLHLSQIDNLNKAGHFLSYEGLKKEAFEALKFNTGNENNPKWRVKEEKVLSYVSGELKRTFSLIGPVKDFDSRVEMKSRNIQLQALQGILDKGHKGMAQYHNVMMEEGSEVSKGYFDSKKAKEKLAYEILSNNSPIIEEIFGQGFSRQLENDAREARSLKLISTYKNSTGLKKAAGATAILRELEAQGSHKKFSLKNHLRAHDLYGKGLELSLYSALDQNKTHFKGSDSEKSLETVESYIKEARSLVDFKKHRNSLALEKAGDMTARYEQGLRALGDQFETFSPHKRLRFEGANLVKHVFDLSKEAKIPHLDQIKAYDHDSRDVLKVKGRGVYRPIRAALTQHIEDLNESKHWKLTSDQIKIFTGSVLSVALEKRVLDSEMYNAEKKGPIEKALDSSKEAAGFTLMETPLGDSMRDRSEKWAKNLVGSYDAHCSAKIQLKAFVQSEGLEKSKIASSVVTVMDSKSDPMNRHYTRKYFNESGFYRNSVELSVYSAFEKASEGFSSGEKKSSFDLVQRFEGAYVQRRDAYIVMRNIAEGSVDPKVKDNYEKAQDDVFDVFAKVSGRGVLQQWDLRTLEKNALNLVWSGEQTKVPGRIEKDLAALNERKGYGISEPNLKEFQGSLLQSVGAKGDYENSVQDNIKGDEKSQKAYQKLQKTEQEASTALLKPDIGKKLVKEDGKWSMDLKKYTVASLVKDLVVDYQNSSGGKRQALYEEIRQQIFGPEGKKADREGLKICKEHKIFFKRVSQGVGDHGQALGPQQGPYKREGNAVVKNEEKNYHQKRDLQRSSSNYDTSQLVKDAVNSVRLEDLSQDLLGKYGHNQGASNSNLIAFKKKGSLIVNLSGDREGSWYDFKSRKGGSVFNLIIDEKGLDFKGALSYISSYCRGSVVQEIEGFLKGEKGREISPAERHARIEADLALKEQRDAERQKTDDRKISDVKHIVSQSKSIEGTPAEVYLRKERGIQGALPGSLRYIPPQTSFSYNGNETLIKGGAMLSIATDRDGEVKAVQITQITENGQKAVGNDGSKMLKRTYGIQKSSFVELQNGSEKEPIILAEGVESALSVKESGIKGTVLCSLGIYNIGNLDVKNRDVIIAADWDGSFEVQTWKTTEKAKTDLEDKGNTVSIILPVKNPELTIEKLDFNDLLKKEGIESIIDRVSDRLPGVIGQEPSLRDLQKESKNDKTFPIASDQERPDRDQHEPSTKSEAHLQEKPLEKDSKALDWEALRKINLIKRQYEVVIAHRQNNRKPSNAFLEEFSINPEQALHTVTLYDSSVKPLLEKTHFESLMKPCMSDGHIDKEATLSRQYQLIIDYKNKFGKPTETIEAQFKENPETAIRVQMAWDQNIAAMLDPKVSPEDALKFLDPPALEKELDPAVSVEEQGFSAENGKEIDSENAAEDSNDKQRNQGLSL